MLTTSRSTLGTNALAKHADVVASACSPGSYSIPVCLARSAFEGVSVTKEKPSAPITTPRRILEIGARAIGVPARITTLPSALLPVAGLFSPMLGEMSEMQFQWDRAYQVDASKFANRFGAEATPFEVGAAATARSFAEAYAPDALRSAIL